MAKTPPPPRPATRPAPPAPRPPAPDDPDTAPPAPADDPLGSEAPPPDDPGPTPPRRPARSEDPPPRATAPLRVRAIRDGYYGEKYRRTGDVFTLERGDPLARWMAEVDPETPEHTTSHGQALQEQRTEVMTQRAIERGSGAGVQAPIDNPDDGLDPIGAREG